MKSLNIRWHSCTLMCHCLGSLTLSRNELLTLWCFRPCFPSGFCESTKARSTFFRGHFCWSTNPPYLKFGSRRPKPRPVWWFLKLKGNLLYGKFVLRPLLYFHNRFVISKAGFLEPISRWEQSNCASARLNWQSWFDLFVFVLFVFVHFVFFCFVNYVYICICIYIWFPQLFVSSI